MSYGPILSNPAIYTQVSLPSVDIYGNSQYWNGYSWQSAPPTPNNLHSQNNGILYTYGGEIVICKDDGSYLHLIETLNKIMDSLGMMPSPNLELMEKYPALELAYREYQDKFSEALAKQNPELKAAIESFKVIEALVKNEESGK